MHGPSWQMDEPIQRPENIHVWRRERGIGACRCIGSSAQFNHTQINLYMLRHQIAAPCNFWPAPAARGGKLKLIHRPWALQYWRSMSRRAPIHQCSNGANLKRILVEGAPSRAASVEQWSKIL
jgi:hypothetical protein